MAILTGMLIGVLLVVAIRKYSALQQETHALALKFEATAKRVETEL
jgi:hypothetical protein